MTIDPDAIAKKRANLEKMIASAWGGCASGSQHTWEKRDGYCPSCSDRWDVVVEFLVKELVTKS